jgi:hypothetical protein
VNHQATFLTYNLYLSTSLMVIVAIRALGLEYLVKILDWGRSRSRHIFTDSDSAALVLSISVVYKHVLDFVMCYSVSERKYSVPFLVRTSLWIFSSYGSTQTKECTDLLVITAPLLLRYSPAGNAAALRRRERLYLKETSLTSNLSPFRKEGGKRAWQRD